MDNNELSSLEKTIIIALLTLFGMAILSGLISCSSTKVYLPKNTYYSVKK